MQPTIVPIVLAGGVGSRLWPVSRTFYPKQFHNIIGEKSLIQQTVQRGQAATSTAPIVVCNEEHRFMVAEQLRAIDSSWHQIILEPSGRNSAPAIALAAMSALDIDPDAIMVVLSSDHLVTDQGAFNQAVQSGIEGAVQGGLATFGVSPDRAETAYGYIEVADAQGGLQAVKSFVEKPDLETAGTYLRSGNYLWNSGMFVFGAQTYLDELQVFEPTIASCCITAMQCAKTDMDFVRPSAEFLESPAKSIDFAVMEKTQRAMVVPVHFGWNDVGSWDAIYDESALDRNGNHLHGDVVAIDSLNSLVMSDNRLVGVVGVENLVVVDTPDALLVANRSEVQKVKKIFTELAMQGRVLNLTTIRKYSALGAVTKDWLKETDTRLNVSKLSPVHH